MIDLDSPVETVLGEPKDKRSRTRNQRIVEVLGIETVGDLLRHFPRRYVAATELTEVATPVVGDQLTIVGEVRSCESAPPLLRVPGASVCILFRRARRARVSRR